MRRACAFGIILTTIFLFTVAAQNKRPLPAQVQRGRDLFTKSEKGPCGTCHAVAGVGAAVGPDLKEFSAYVGPSGIVMAMHMTIPAFVMDITLKDGTTFAGMEKQKQGDDLDIDDLSQSPPALRKVTAKDITGKKVSATWKHPPTTIEYTSQELADIIGFLKWAANGSTKEIKPDEVEVEK